MTHDIHSDPQIAEFVTKVMEMAPAPPTFPETVVAVAPAARRGFAPWMWAPVAAAAAVLVIAPIALRGGGDDGDFAGVPVASQAATDENTSDASIDPINGGGPVVPEVEQERNTLSLDVAAIAPGGIIVVDFSGGDNAMARSDLFWMDRFGYAERQWFAEWILWSDRSDGGARFAPAASTSVIVPPLYITEDGYDSLLIPTDLPLGTYRVCIGTTHGACGVFEVSDEIVPSSADGPADGPVEPIGIVVAGPSFGRVALAPSNLAVVLTPAEWLIGPDAVLVARSDGFIGPDEDLPNDFYLRMNPSAITVELAVGPDAQVTVTDLADPSVQQVLTFAEWAALLEAQAVGLIGPIFVHLTYDADGSVLTIAEQYVP